MAKDKDKKSTDPGLVIDSELTSSNEIKIDITKPRKPLFPKASKQPRLGGKAKLIKSGKTKLRRAGKVKDSDPNKVEKSLLLQAARMSMNLTHREFMFCCEYLSDGDRVRAAIAAGYSRKWAGTIAYALCQKPKIREFLERERARALKSKNVNMTQVMEQLRRIAFSDIRDLLSWERIKRGKGKETFFQTNIVLKDSKDISDEAAATIAEISQTPDGGIKFKRESRTDALRQLAAQFGSGTLRQLQAEGLGQSPAQQQARPGVQLQVPVNLKDLSDEELEALDRLVSKVSTGPDELVQDQPEKRPEPDQAEGESPLEAIEKEIGMSLDEFDLEDIS